MGSTNCRIRKTQADPGVSALPRVKLIRRASGKRPKRRRERDSPAEPR